MPDLTYPRFEGRRVLIVEDEYVIAMEIAGILEDCGAEIVGPAGSVSLAIQLIAQEAPIDAAVLDVNLGRERVFPVAETLNLRNIPFVFATGYDASLLVGFETSPRLEKPLDPRAMAWTISKLVDSGDGGRGRPFV
jgi:CheY-like chemotaxis protein